MKQGVVSSRAMVVGTSGLAAIRAAVDALREGGSAVDAAMVAALTQTALSAGSWDSYAGIMSMVYYGAETGIVHSMNAAYNTVQEEKDPLSIPCAGKPSGRTALVPGFMAGVQAAHNRFGALPFSKLFESAIEYAEKGVVVDSILNKLFKHRKDVLTRLPEGREIFLNDRGELYKQGDLFKQPQLAETLRKVAAEGADYMYQGEWAQRFVKGVGKEGGKITLKDMEAYEVIWSQPLQTTYRDYEIFTPGFPGFGGAHVVEAMNLLECADLARYGHYTSSAEALYWLIQITHAAYLEPFFPSELRAEKEAAICLWNEMQRQGGLSVLDGFRIQKAVNHSDGVVAVDEAGNIAAICHSINTIAWGTTGIFVDGVSIPDSACFQQIEIERIGAGVRLPEAMNPLIVIKNGKPILASVCTGTSLHETTIQNLVNILDYGMEPKKSVDTPCFMGPVTTGIFTWITSKNKYCPSVGQWWYYLITWVAMVFFPFIKKIGNVEQAVEKDDFSKEILGEVRSMGQAVKVVGKTPPRGYWAGIFIDAQKSRLQGAATSKTADNDAAALGY